MELLTNCWLIAVAWTAIGDTSAQETLPDGGFRPLVAEVRDFTEITEADRLPYFRLLAAVRRQDSVQRQRAPSPTAASAAQAAGHSQFADIYRHPEKFRGELIRIRGYVRALSEWDATSDNSEGLTTLYQAWVFTEDSLRNPYVIVCSEVSPGLRARIGHGGKQDTSEPVEVDGVFFKIWKYEARDGTRGAPMILAHRLDWKPSANSSSGNWLWTVAALLLGVVFSGLLLIVRTTNRQDREFRKRHLQSPSPFVAGPDPCQSLGDERTGDGLRVTPTEPKSPVEP